MRCYHLTANPPPLPIAHEACQWLEVAGNQALVVHADWHQCAHPESRLHHILKPHPVGPELAAALSAWGVVAGDTLQQAMLKVAEDWAAAWP
jgi:hypothetical protein